MERGWAMLWENWIRVAMANPMPLALIAYLNHTAQHAL